MRVYEDFMSCEPLELKVIIATQRESTTSSYDPAEGVQAQSYLWNIAPFVQISRLEDLFFGYSVLLQTRLKPDNMKCFNILQVCRQKLLKLFIFNFLILKDYFLLNM